MSMSIRFLMASGLMLCAAVQLQAAVYQWTDEQGQVHFSDRPVHEEATEKQIHTSPERPSGQSAPDARKQKRQRMLDVYEHERAEKREAVAKDKQQREERKRRCINARARYENYSRAGSIYQLDENGKRTYFEKGQRERYIAELKAEVDRYCR
jgi:hypothetical protein